ncbi:hypothetical protein CMUS01_12632 [Colletotrichum musicola]|uniref:Uncharacterized protein n=1 Tax=Colletotrichum musicola TaxID=2175873 RepID=A0A8H6JKZ4_9PEZI|nr:hypothetical protein CMUS01_12632 [Colletotrichum musicola]
MTQKQLVAEGIKYPENFPLAREVKRGMLRLFGRGEGNGNIFGTPTHGANPVIAAETYGSQDPADDAFSETAASPSPAGDWGQVGSLSPPSLGGGIGYSSSTLTPEGNPDYSEAKVNQYVASFMANIFTMHPIIMPGDLNLLVKRFLDSVAINGDRKAKPTNPGIAKFAPPPTQYADASSKRKRSPSGDQVEEPVLSKRPGRPHRTIESALVLVVLALGKVCLHQERIPDPAPTPETEHSTNSPMTRNGHPSSPGPAAHTSPPAYASHQSSGLPSPKEQNNNYSSRRPSLQGSGAKTGGQSYKRNYDIIPGLEYMAVACDILGQHQVGWTLKHAQVFILCGLYYGQLGRVIESHAHLLNADRALQMIMQRKITDGSPDAPGQITNRRDNIVLITYWTCLQLISDIVAELKLPLSQVLNYEEMMPYPNMTMMANEIPVEVIKLYFGQLYLRKQLNKIHNTLYKPDPPGQEPPHPIDKFTKAMDIQRGLQSFQWIPPEYHFTEDDPPATNLNEARLRAKYWGTQTLIYRQILKLVLDIGVRTRKQDEGTTPTSDTAGGLGVFSHGDARSFIGHSVTTSDELGPQVEEYTKAGLKAFIRSTEAFHGVDSKRLLVTNIFGTAHAQWGNLLILGAAYRDPWCRRFIDGQHLQSLFQRTIRVFKTHAQTTSALAVDMRVLETVERELFSQTFDDPRTTTSFSSAASGGNTLGPLGPPPPPPPPPQPPQNNPPNNHQMSMAFAVEPNHHSAHNSPSQGHRMLNHGSNHVHNHTQPY